ncbi:DUF1857 family protein [bacterium]|nr:DUF1857 family protein [bacterium]
MEFKYTLWLDAPHDRVWHAIKDQIEHPKAKNGQFQSINVIERKKNYLVREVKPKRGRKFQEKITFFPSRKAITEMSRGPYESIVQEVTKEKGRTKLTMEFKPRRMTLWLLKMKQWVKRAPLELDDLMNLTSIPKPVGAKNK